MIASAMISITSRRARDSTFIGLDTFSSIIQSSSWFIWSTLSRLGLSRGEGRPFYLNISFVLFISLLYQLAHSHHCFEADRRALSNSKNGCFSHCHPCRNFETRTVWKFDNDARLRDPPMLLTLQIATSIWVKRVVNMNVFVPYRGWGILRGL